MKPIPTKEIAKRLRRLSGWKALGSELIRREYRMRDFSSAVRLIVKISTLAEKMDHHPDIHLTGYRKLRVELTTHWIGGLSRKDFMLAGRIEALPKKLKEA